MADGASEASRRDAPLDAWIRALGALRLLERAPTVTLASLVDDLARTHGDRPALIGDDQELSYRQLARRTNRVARWALAQGIATASGNAHGTACLLMRNCPDYVALWLGLTRAGCRVALINTNLTGDALLHSIRTAGATHVIVDETLSPAIAAIAGQLPRGAKLWSSVAADLARHDGAPIEPGELRLPDQAEVALLVYTSGTTGLPKAARLTHRRVLEWSLWFAGMMDVRSDDRLYDCLPLYHSTGGISAVGAMLVRGGSVLIRQRFSASRFWDDVVDGNCTIFQYIGELCRYLLASPPHPKEARHRLRLACGNGLQGEVWQGFQERFAVPRILEFYAATEGAVSLYNCDGKPGAIGRVPPFLAPRFPVALIRCDPETGAPLRDARGFCVACGADEAGEAIGRLDPAAGAGFSGYTDAAASARKLLHDVFARGDRWFRTGDLMRRDAAGHFFFLDRLGDTFRWKGENVSTTEVASAIRRCPGVTDAVVYGVSIPGHEGRAGMAALTVDHRFSLAALSGHLAATLPDYARPMFLRTCAALEVTGTFKLSRSRLVAEGYGGLADPVWFRDRATGRYVPYRAALLEGAGGGWGRA